ncbi:hypothetical protein SISSUDRAFT_1058490 [Sistotremastrum suecicum HHB10207 ss-3]|uniref:Methyltransferase domain-containing protein n=1 Tax=Sistotremastrum suecicum HHB10207 ss-3 TaxID=1314776 RepID=A0A166H6M6_9AGAM|nr:hypothetical protein SISSUDRAFT_1058490 [Sistotremastrum suecicum HHB10207 ss-3]
MAISDHRLKLLLLSLAGLSLYFRPTISDIITSRLTGSAALTFWIVSATIAFILCRLALFYEGQADVYDATRSGLLRGRNTMLALSASHLRHIRKNKDAGKLIWVDIGGGTGHNLELMDKYYPISSFDHVYLVDLCEPLLQVARQRVAKRGWKNVTVLCQDATNFTLPIWSGSHPVRGCLGFVTLSYSLSMIPGFYTLLDRIDYLLHPDVGLLGVVDFYTSGRQLSLHEKAIGGSSKECGWLSRWFWQIWFDFDHVSLSPHRRDYLEYKFGTIKSYNGRNRFIVPFIVRIPYYIWLGRSRAQDVSRLSHTFQEDLPIGTVIKSDATETSQPSAPGLETAIEISPPLSSFHYQVQHFWRMPYYESPAHKQFRTFIYSFTWEDPVEDMMRLNISADDSLFVITSAGDNALHYAIGAQPKRIHCVDMNPCQGHLLELKLAAIQTLEFDDFFALFGEGRHPDFRALLDKKIAPLLSSSAYQFWRINEKAFSSSFYLRGYSGWALRMAKWAFWIAGVSDDVAALCRAASIDEQQRIWDQKLRPVIMNPVVVALLKNPIFCWNALGVPLNQRQIFLQEGTAYDFIRETLDPIPSHSLLSKGAYFYLLALLGHYERNSCPDYLTHQGYLKLRENDGEAARAFRLHTEPIVDVLHGLQSSSLTRAIIMDHLDWFGPGTPEVDVEISELFRVLEPGGIVLWRSAAKHPWYNKNFIEAGFSVSLINMRTSANKAIDRVNMYASCWKAEKPRL